jgi:hypothetical protein
MKMRYILPVHLLFAFSLALLAGCSGAAAGLSSGAVPDSTPTPTESSAVLTFQSIGQGYLLSSTQSKPAVRLATDAGSLAALDALVTPDHRALLKNIDLEKNVILATFWGVRASGGCSITIEKLFIDDAGLTVSVLLNENDAGIPRVDASSYPYHLISVARSSLPREANLHYRLVDRDGVLAEGDLP